VLARLRLEVDPLFKNGVLEDRSDVTELQYATAVWRETLRIASPASMIRLELDPSVKEYELSDGVVIDGSKGDQVEICIDAFARDPDVFDNPLEYAPERWLTPDAAKLQKMNEYFVIFGGGRRVCPGMGLANVEGIYIAANMAHHLDFKLDCEPGEIKRLLNFTVIPNKMPVKIKRRAMS
jgi:flavonoid 3',5'-hydroxylase